MNDDTLTLARAGFASADDVLNALRTEKAQHEALRRELTLVLANAGVSTLGELVERYNSRGRVLTHAEDLASVVLRWSAAQQEMIAAAHTVRSPR